MKRQTLIFVIGLIAVVGAILWKQYPISTSAALTHDDIILIHSNEPIDPIPFTVDLDERKVSLGNKLFHDPQLSNDNTVSCASCHSLNKGGTDQLPKSIGIAGQLGEVNAPTVLNAAYNFRQFWDGRAETLEDQAEGPVHNPKEMASNWQEITAKLKLSPDYVAEFEAIYPDGIRNQNIVDAITTFERSLITPNGRFDRYLRGQQHVLTAEELNGYRLFKEYGCASCHQGTNVGGNLFEKFGVMTTNGRPNTSKADLGRYNVTADEADRYVFKVPALRNVALTAPYFHDGSAATLEEAVNTMAVFQLARTLSPGEIQDIVRFLKTLTGEQKTKAK